MDAFTSFIVSFVVTFALIQIVFYFRGKREAKRARMHEEKFAAELKQRQQAIAESLNAAADKMKDQRSREEARGERVYQGHVPPRLLPARRPLSASPETAAPTSTIWPAGYPDLADQIQHASPAAPSYHGGGGSFNGGGASGDWGSSSSSDSGSSYSSSDSGSSSSDSGSSSGGSD